MYYQQQYPTYNNYNTQDERLWVSNAQAAEAYPVAPNAFVRLWDSNQPVFYEKRADATGRPLPIEIYEYKRKVANTMPTVDYKAEIDDLRARIAILEKGVSANAESNTDVSTI